jgi:hypothetical protein
MGQIKEVNDSTSNSNSEVVAGADKDDNRSLCAIFRVLMKNQSFLFIAISLSLIYFQTTNI